MDTRAPRLSNTADPKAHRRAVANIVADSAFRIDQWPAPDDLDEVGNVRRLLPTPATMDQQPGTNMPGGTEDVPALPVIHQSPGLERSPRPVQRIPEPPSDHVNGFPRCFTAPHDASWTTSCGPPRPTWVSKNSGSNDGSSRSACWNATPSSERPSNGDLMTRTVPFKRCGLPFVIRRTPSKSA